MSHIHIKTLTPVHIGSGEMLLYGNDFVYGTFAHDNSPAIGIIDPSRVMQLIGEEHIDHWIAAIERKEPIDRFIKVYAPNATLKDYCRRLIRKKFSHQAEMLKEQLHDRNGTPYLPGSSLKGAIRTAILSMLTTHGNDIENWQDRIRKHTKVTASQVEEELFGEYPNTDVFRFLQVGDAYFGDSCDETAIRMMNLNERERKSFRDESKPQAIETIAAEKESTFQMKLNTRLYETTKKRKNLYPLVWVPFRNC
ncbi:MAG: type III-A CRISPR-associated RAMP protein Csm5 [Bacteroides sp.]|nr:type III-A CRISPR-associated RAMP protein Csm5 [Bacteroides sp.]